MEHPKGFCECGCGGQTTIAKASWKAQGYVRGEPRRFCHGHNRTRGPITENEYEVVEAGYETPCWKWLKFCNFHGYGKVAYKGEVRLAHVVMYEQVTGEKFPEGLVADHLCRIPSCIRPDHIEPVTQTENVRRGRTRKLTYEQVFAIRADPRSSYAVARDYGICPNHAWRIQTKKAYRDL